MAKLNGPLQNPPRRRQNPLRGAGTAASLAGDSTSQTGGKDSLSMWKNIVLIPIAMLIAFVAFEALARLWVTAPSAYPLVPGLLVFDERGFWLPEPGYTGKMDNRVDYRDKTLTINADGSRHVPCAADTKTVAQRIFLLGDSQTFGFGLSDDESWANRLQCVLAEGNKDAPRVYNMGVHGTNIDQYAKRGIGQVTAAVRKGDLVVVGVTWNDLISPQPAPSIEGARADAADLPPSSGALTLNLGNPLRHLNRPTWRYRFYRWSGFLVPSFSSFKTFVESLTYSSVLAHLAVPPLRLLYYRLRAADSFARKLAPEDVTANMTLLSIMAAAIEKQGGHMAVYLLPNRLFFDDAYYRSYSAGGKSFPVQDYMAYLTGPYCERLGLRCVNAFDALRTPGPDTYTFRFDGHYNAAGAEAVAGRLGDYLVRECTADGHPCVPVEK